MADRQYLPLAEPLTLPPALDPPTPHLPWLNANPRLTRLPRIQDVISGQLPILDAQPMPGDLAPTVVAGTLPWTMLPSGMTPGDDSDG